jgi:acyl carrier protein
VSVETFRAAVIAHLSECGVAEPAAKTGLVSDGVLESLQVLGLMLTVETCLGVEIVEDDLTNANFDSVAAIVRLMQRYAGGTQPAALQQTP